MDPVSTPPDEVAARARAIFERLRHAAEPAVVGEPAPVPEPPAASGDASPEAGPSPAAAPVASEADGESVESAVVDEVAPVLAATLAPPPPVDVATDVPVEELATPLPGGEKLTEAEAEAEVPVSVSAPVGARGLPRVMAIANQKGGVGKTTTAVNLGAALAELGYRVLVVDLDPQGNATTGLGVNSRNLEVSLYDVIMHDVPLEDCIEPTSVKNLFVAPATIDLAGAEIELVPAFSRELKLRRAIEQGAEGFDFTLIDCPPSLGLLTVNGLAAASEVVVPIQCEYYALEGLGQLMRNVTLVKSNLNPDLDLSTIILTMYDARTKLAEQVASEVRRHVGPKVCRNIVPRTVRLSEAPSFGQPIIVFDPSSRGAIAYRELAKEVSGGAPQRIG
jgi:chromosome partitioning protein